MVLISRFILLSSRLTFLPHPLRPRLPLYPIDGAPLPTPQIQLQGPHRCLPSVQKDPSRSRGSLQDRGPASDRGMVRQEADCYCQGRDGNVHDSGL
jgi:hypothetical protein